ncbi:MAG: TIGR03643 family protein [Chitinophagaceae bacterium]
MRKELSGYKSLGQADIDRIVEMAWEDRTPFDAIAVQFGVSENETIGIMRSEMKASSFKMWRQRVQGRVTKHSALRIPRVNRFKCARQKIITMNKVSKR